MEEPNTYEKPTRLKTGSRFTVDRPEYVKQVANADGAIAPEMQFPEER